MIVENGQLEGLLLIRPRRFGDDRGWFLESWQEQRYREAGIREHFVQDNFSRSAKNVLRGLHFQNPNAQGKLVMVLEGDVWDVAVDMRRSSPTFRRWQGVRLRGDKPVQFYVPPGFAHGFVVLSDTALFHYKCTALYAPADEASVRWNDPELGVEWPVSDPVLSAKDAGAPLLCDLPSERLYP
jgi:dTDP-4-dehydrorhamnose 3,5-epimerase